MKKNNKGFTLIELLAVIVILAIIALIAVPIVLNLIEKSRIGAAEDSAYGLRKSAQLYYSTSLLENTSGEDIIFNCDKINGCISEKIDSEGNKVKLDIDGTKPTNGKIEISSDGNITYSDIVINGYLCKIENKGIIKCSNRENSNDESTDDTLVPSITLGVVTSTENSVTIPYIADDVNATVICEYGLDTNYGNIGTIENSSCLMNELEMGTKYFYKLTITNSSNNNDFVIGTITTSYTSNTAVTLGGYNWHVINDDGTNLTLLMDAGQLGDNNSMAHCTNDGLISTDCSTASSHYVYSWDKSLIREYLNNTLYSELSSKIDNMIPTEICADHSRNDGSVTYGGYLVDELNEIDNASCNLTVNDYVRLISPKEYTDIKSTNSGDWLYSSSIDWWWTMGSDSQVGDKFVRRAYDVNASGNLSSDSGQYAGAVRPVITINGDLTNYIVGAAVTLGDYNWHVIKNDGKKAVLLMDAGQLGENNNNMAHCTRDGLLSTDCLTFGNHYVYSWDKSLIREYLNNTLYSELSSKIDNMVPTEICADDSRSDGVATYGGYLINELNEIENASCNRIVSDYVRLISTKEFTDIKSTNNDDWLYSSSIGAWWTMGSDSQVGETIVRRSYDVNTSGNLSSDSAHYASAIRPVITVNGDLTNYTVGAAVTLGDYNWHVIKNDGKNAVLLMDAGQLNDNNNMAHCTNDGFLSTDCSMAGPHYVYSWDKSLIRTYLNNTLYSELANKIENEIIPTEICADDSRNDGAVTYGGYLINELDEIENASCNRIVNDYVRLISPNEFNEIKTSAEGDWLYSSSIGAWWTMGAYSENDDKFVRRSYDINVSGNLSSDSGQYEMMIRPVITIKK